MNEPDLNIYLIFLLGFGVPLLVLPAAFYMHRHWSVQKRLAVAPLLFVISTLLMVYLICANSRKSGGHLLACISLSIFWLSQTIVAFYLWRKVRRQARGAAAVRRPPPVNVDPFFWQGLLILLPVVIMALVAGTAIVKDRATVEREARQRAEEILQQVNRTHQEASDGGFRYLYEKYLQDWGYENLDEKTLWPGGILRANYAAGRSRFGNWEKWKEMFPELASLPEGGAIVFWPSFNADGGIRPLWSVSDFKSEPPGDDPPQIPPWRLQLSPEQFAAWNSLGMAVRAANGPAFIEAAARKFKDTEPPNDAVTNAEFIMLRTKLADESATNAISKLLELGVACEQTRSESGVPLSDLALADALERAVITGPSEQLWNRLYHRLVVSPGFFTPTLLDLAEPLVRNNPEMTDCLKAMKVRWKATEQMWAVAELIQQSGKLHGLAATNLWLDFEGGHWFCILEPFGERKEYIESRIFPLSEILRELDNAISVPIPKYFSVTAELEGAGAFCISQGGKTNLVPSGAILAELPDVVSGPDYPRCVFRIQLADANLMFAAQRQRAFLIGGLILASALAAFVGFLAARRAFYRQLRLNEMKSDFVSSVSHELRAPIASVRLMAEGLEYGRISEPGKQHEYYKFIVQECRRLSSLIENVLDFSRIEQGRKQYEMESTDLVALTEKTVTLMETYAAERQISVVLEKTGEPTPVELDGKAMQQALVNLIDNAIKHSPKGSEIVVGLEFKLQLVSRSGQPEASRPGLRACLWVEDVGEGIPAAEHEKIFERFYRVGSELRRETQGVGIGLSIVKHIVEAHNGRVTVRSAPGQGSRFTIELLTM